MTMFGYDRRPELFKEPVYPDPMIWYEWTAAAACGGMRLSAKRCTDIAYEMKSVFHRSYGPAVILNGLDASHAAPKVAELWAFETGRLP